MDLDKEFAEKLVLQFEPLLHKTLHKVGLRQSYDAYDDHLQELRIKLLNIARNFKGDIFGQNIGQFINYAKKGLYWFLLDKFRQQNNTTIKEVSMDVNALASQNHGDFFFDEKINVNVFLQEARLLLSPRELEIFNMLIQGAFTMQEIADHYGLNRKTVHMYKKRIRHKLERIKYLLF